MGRRGRSWWRSCWINPASEQATVDEEPAIARGHNSCSNRGGSTIRPSRNVSDRRGAMRVRWCALQRRRRVFTTCAVSSTRRGRSGVGSPKPSRESPCGRARCGGRVARWQGPPGSPPRNTRVAVKVINDPTHGTNHADAAFGRRGRLGVLGRLDGDHDGRREAVCFLDRFSPSPRATSGRPMIGNIALDL